jgi:energy-coupling factor transporter ATP-binding protein EcfA2
MSPSKSIVINLGSGTLSKGFSNVTARFWTSDNRLSEQYIGSLPSAPHLNELYRNWQSIYLNLNTRLQMRTLSQAEEDDELEILEEGIVNVSEVGFEELCQVLQISFNDWLRAEEFLNIDRQIRSRLDRREEIRLIIETSDDLLRRLPWQCWDFLADYSNAEIALARPEYKRRDSKLAYRKEREKVRILAILGDSHDIDLSAERKFLASIADAEAKFLVNPSRQEFNDLLWDSLGWDILFFAGHSCTKGETGKIYLNENSDNNSLTIEQLREALKTAIANGLQLAIFNSCDGLGLALAMEKLNIPVTIVMRESISNYVAQVFFKHFLEAFALERQSLYLSVQKARRRLQGLENNFPGASWLPVICHNPATETPTWLQLGGTMHCPYRGLYAFREEDTNLFFGREQIVSDLVAAVRKQPLVAIVGASASGKSSVVFAGLIPRLKNEKVGIASPSIVSFRPGKNPFQALAIAIASFSKKFPAQQHSNSNELLNIREFLGNLDFGVDLSRNVANFSTRELEIRLRSGKNALNELLESCVKQNIGTPIVLIADQFEELYTLCPEPERQPFLDILLQAVRGAANFTLVLTLRADFYGYALAYRPFSDALQGAVYNLGAMNREELQLAIEAPAKQMQIKLERGLTELLILEMKGQSGSLPLLEFALTQLWSKQKKGVLTHQTYQAIGGVGKALANHAEAVYAELNGEERLKMQRVFVQLVRWGEETEVTRHLATREEVKPENWKLVTRLASARLVTTNRNESTKEETVEIVHEALIKSWGRLEYWFVSDRDFRKWQERLRLTIGTWKKYDRDVGILLRGKPLAEAEEFYQKRSEDLSESERAFIDLSLKHRDAKLKLKQQQFAILKSLLGFASLAFLVAVGLGIVAFRESRRATESQIDAIATSSDSLFSSNQRLEALIRAIEAKRLLQKLGTVKGELESRVTTLLEQSIYSTDENHRLLGQNAVAFSRDRNFIATSQVAMVYIWKRDGKLWKTLSGHKDVIWSLAFSPNSQLIASASDDKTVKIWSLDGTLVSTLKGHNGVIRKVVFSPDGQIIASGSDDRTIKLWQPNGNLISTLKGHSDGVLGVAFSSDARTLASASGDNTIKLWQRDCTNSPKGDCTTGHYVMLRTLKGHQRGVWKVVFSRDGQFLASASEDGTVKLWTRNGQLLQTLRSNDDILKSISALVNQGMISRYCDRKSKIYHS